MQGTGDLVDRLVRLGETSPDRVLYVELLDGTNESATLTAGQLMERSQAVAAGLRERDVPAGEVALHICTAPTDFLVGLFGCLWAGVIAAPIAFPRRADHLESRLGPVRENAGAAAVVAGTPQNDAERDVLELLTGGDLPVVSTDAPAASGPVDPASGRDVAYLQYTSGSTSVPKGVIVTHDNLIANLAECEALLGFSDEMVTVSWCPLTHDMGLVMGAMPAVSHGAKTVLMPPGAFIRRPLTWLRAIDTYRGTHTYSPNFGYDLCVERSSQEDREALDLSSMQVWINGAEPVRLQTRERFMEAFVGPSGLRRESYTPAWGLAEATVLVTAAPMDSDGKVVWVDAEAIERDEIVLRGPDDEGTRVLCCDGIPGPGYDIRIVDPETRTAQPPDRVGEIWVRGPSVCPGYWRRDEATAAAYGWTVEGETDGAGEWMRTGDLGFLFEGEVVICGRAKDLIIINGRNIHPQDIELTVEESHPDVRLGGSAAFAIGDEGATESLVVLAEVDGEPDHDEIKKVIVAAVLADFDVRLADVLLLGPREVPKTSSGKKQRSAAREHWRRSKETAEV